MPQQQRVDHFVVRVTRKDHDLQEKLTSDAIRRMLETILSAAYTVHEGTLTEVFETAHQFDQHREPVPDDLILLPKPCLLGPERCREIRTGADWYEAEHPDIGKVLMARFEDLAPICAPKFLPDGDLAEATGIKIKDCVITRIDGALRRGDAESFYHA